MNLEHITPRDICHRAMTKTTTVTLVSVVTDDHTGYMHAGHTDTGAVSAASCDHYYGVIAYAPTAQWAKSSRHRTRGQADIDA